MNDNAIQERYEKFALEVCQEPEFSFDVARLEISILLESYDESETVGGLIVVRSPKKPIYKGLCIKIRLRSNGNMGDEFSILVNEPVFMEEAKQVDERFKNSFREGVREKIAEWKKTRGVIR